MFHKAAMIVSLTPNWPLPQNVLASAYRQPPGTLALVAALFTMSAMLVMLDFRFCNVAAVASLVPAPPL